MNIKEALANMDALDDDQWTADGMPKLSSISESVGSQISRQEVVDSAPEFSRGNMIIPEDADQKQDPDEKVDPELPDVNFEILEKYLAGDPLPEREFIKYLNEVDAPELEALEQILVEQMDEANKAINLAEDLRNRVKLSLAYTRNRIKKEIPDLSNQQAIRTFIKSQTADREKRIIKTREILKGVDLKTLDPRAAIDRAMARKNTRGLGRPSRPLM